METITERITRLRIERKISQSAVGNALGVSQQAFSKMNSWSDNQFTVGHLREIAKVLDVPMTVLIFKPEELALLSSPDPLISPIVAEVSRIAALPDREQSDTYLSVLLASAKAMK